MEKQVSLQIQSVEPAKRRDGSLVEGISDKGSHWQLYKINGKYSYFNRGEKKPQFVLGDQYICGIEQVEKDGYVNFQINSIKPQKPDLTNTVDVQREDTEHEWVKAIPVTHDDLQQLWDKIGTIEKRLDKLSEYNKQLAEGKTPEIPVIED